MRGVLWHNVVWKFENRYNESACHRLFVQFLRPYLQCWRCEKPFGCLQLMLCLYFRDHLCLCVCAWVLRAWVRVRDLSLVDIDVFDVLMDIYIYIYIYT